MCVALSILSDTDNIPHSDIHLGCPLSLPQAIQTKSFAWAVLKSKMTNQRINTFFSNNECLYL